MTGRNYKSTSQNVLCDKLKQQYGSRIRTAFNSSNDRRNEAAFNNLGVAKPQYYKTKSSDFNPVSVYKRAYSSAERVRVKTAMARNSRPVRVQPRNTESKKVQKLTLVNRFRIFAGHIFESHFKEIRGERTPFPLATVSLLAICTIMVMVIVFNFVQVYESTSEISTLRDKQYALQQEADMLEAKLADKNDIRVIEKMAKEELGMVSGELAQTKYISVNSEDRVENIKYEDNQSAMSTLLSAIGSAIGRIGDYFG